MINAVSTSQNDYSLIVTSENSKEATNGEQKRPDEENLGYKLSLSDENWKTLGKKGNQELSEDDQRKVEELRKIDKRVHTHEQAHLSAAGGYVRGGGAQYDYVTGPDGNKYANAGHVNLDTSREKTPEATIRKANIIQKAALAPADPSPADKQIAANAAKMALDAQQELVEEQKAKMKSSETTKTTKSAKTPETQETPETPETPDAPQVATVSESSG